jgi:hypothetical protein
MSKKAEVFKVWFLHVFFMILALTMLIVAIDYKVESINIIICIAPEEESHELTSPVTTGQQS